MPASRAKARPQKGAGRDEGVLLGAYRAKRDFDRTPEPQGATVPPSANGRRFVVQRHRARRLHYDLRLEMDGVLASWAVPKGPTMDPSRRRLAVQVEDHPLGYFDFEGVIPSGNYGAGDVIVWDWGTWEPDHGEEPGKAVRTGELHVELHGEKLSGRFVLVRSERGGRRSQDLSKEKWLMIRKRDEGGIEGWDAEQYPRSVKSGRTNDDVKDWGSALN